MESGPAFVTELRTVQILRLASATGNHSFTFFTKAGFSERGASVKRNGGSSLKQFRILAEIVTEI